jgi:hypothetical protein
VLVGNQNFDRELEDIDAIANIRKVLAGTLNLWGSSRRVWWRSDVR